MGLYIFRTTEFPKDEKSYLQLALKLDKEPGQKPPKEDTTTEATKEPVTN